MARFRERSPVREWSPWDKAFRANLGVFLTTILVWGVYIYINGLVDPFKDSAGIVQQIMRIDTIVSFLTVFGMVIIGVRRRHSR